MPRREDDRDRPSWRDIDRKKDSSHHADQSDPYKKNHYDERTDGRSKSYRSALDSFFDGKAVPERFEKLAKTRQKISTKGGGSKRQKALRKLAEAVGRFEVEDAVRAFLNVDGELPRDADVLLNVLQHSDEALVRQAIVLLDEVLLERPFKRNELLKQRLRQVEDLAEEPDTVELASKLRHKV